MSKYFGKCFGPSTRAPKFLTQMPYLFIIKICFTIKVNSICGAGRDTRNLCHKFNPQGPSARILGVRFASPKSKEPSCRVLGVRVSVLGSWVAGFQSFKALGLRVPGYRVSVPDFRLCRENMQQIYRRTPMLLHGCSPVNLLHMFRTHFLKDISGRLLLVRYRCYL